MGCEVLSINLNHFTCLRVVFFFVLGGLFSDRSKVMLFVLILSIWISESTFAQLKCAKGYTAFEGKGSLATTENAFKFEVPHPISQIHTIPVDALKHMDSETQDLLGQAHLLFLRILEKPHSLEETQKLQIESLGFSQKLQEARRAYIQQKREKRFLLARLKNLQRSSPKSFAARIRSLENEIEMDQRVADIIGQILNPLRQQLGRMTIALSSYEIAKKHQTVVILRALQSEAVGHMMHKGFGKGIRYKFHSSTDEVLAGMVPRNQKLSKKGKSATSEELAKLQEEVEEAISKGIVVPIPFKIGSLVAVEQNGKIEMVDTFRQPVDRMKIVQVLAEPADVDDPKLLVSDVDPFGFARKIDFPSSPVLDTTQYGKITEEEKEIVQDFNQSISRLLGRNSPHNRYMPHGPENRNPHSKDVNGYPLEAYFPDGRKETIPQGPKGDPDRYYREFLEGLQTAGFHLEQNPLWK